MGFEYVHEVGGTIEEHGHHLLELGLATRVDHVRPLLTEDGLGGGRGAVDEGHKILLHIGRLQQSIKVCF